MPGLKLSESERMAGFRLLGLAEYEWEAVRIARDLPTASRMLEELRARARLAFRNTARKLHPDVGGNEADFKRIGLCIDWLKQISAGDVWRGPGGAGGPRVRYTMESEGPFHGGEPIDFDFNTGNFSATAEEILRRYGFGRDSRRNTANERKEEAEKAARTESRRSERGRLSFVQAITEERSSVDGRRIVRIEFGDRSTAELIIDDDLVVDAPSLAEAFMRGARRSW